MLKPVFCFHGHLGIAISGCAVEQCKTTMSLFSCWCLNSSIDHSPVYSFNCSVGLVLGLLLFTTYMSAVGKLIKSYSMSYHQFAADTQLLVSMDRTNAMPPLTGSATVHLWFLQNGLQLNADKSEVVFLGTSAQLKSAANITTVDVAGSTLPVASQLKSLCMTIDSNLQFDCRARNIAKACCFHTYAVYWLMTSPRQSHAASSFPGWTTLMRCWVAHWWRLSTNYSTPRTTRPESSARAGVTPTPGHWFARCTGF